MKNIFIDCIKLQYYLLYKNASGAAGFKLAYASPSLIQQTTGWRMTARQLMSFHP